MDYCISLVIMLSGHNLLPSFFAVGSTTDRNPSSTLDRMSVRTALARKYHGGFWQKKIGWSRGGHCLWLLICVPTNWQQAQSPEHVTTLIMGKWNEGGTCQHPWRITHPQRIKPMLGSYTWDTGALWNRSPWLADPAYYSVLKASSSPISTLPCDILKRCPQCFHHAKPVTIHCCQSGPEEGQ